MILRRNDASVTIKAAGKYLKPNRHSAKAAYYEYVNGLENSDLSLNQYRRIRAIGKKTRIGLALQFHREGLPRSTAENMAWTRTLQFVRNICERTPKPQRSQVIVQLTKVIDEAVANARPLRV